VQLCHLLQERLNVPVSNIAWGHPNIRDPKAKGGKEAWGREHQIRIYAHEFLRIGFSVDYKNKTLKELAKENIRRFPNMRANFCNPLKKKIRTKSISHKGEKVKDLPKEIRGKHFNAYWEICAELGCKKAKEAIKEISKQRRMKF